MLERQESRTPSPNGGLTMALTAAGLGVRLTKRGVYVAQRNGPGGNRRRDIRPDRPPYQTERSVRFRSLRPRLRV